MSGQNLTFKRSDKLRSRRSLTSMMKCSIMHPVTAFWVFILVLITSGSGPSSQLPQRIQTAQAYPNYLQQPMLAMNPFLAPPSQQNAVKNAQSVIYSSQNQLDTQQLPQQQQQQQQSQSPQQSQSNDQIQPTSSADQMQSQIPRSLDREGPIFRFFGTPINGTSVKLIWSVISGYHVDYFDIQWGPMPDGLNVFSVNKLNGSAREYTFHQLQPETHYQFQLHSYSNGHAHKPQLVLVKTLSLNQMPRGQQDFINRDIMPLGVKAEAKSNSTIQLSWSEAERPAHLRNSSRVNIIRYHINPPSLSSGLQSLANADQATNSNASNPQYYYLNVTNTRESRLIVQKLKPATEYAFAIKTAYYSPDLKRIYVQSGFSMDTVAKTFDLEPSPPRNLTIQPLPPTKEEQAAGQLGRLELTWLPPDSPNGQLRGYIILYSNDAAAPDDKWNPIEVIGGNINNWSVTNIRHGHSYYFKVRAVNQRGPSSDSELRSYMAPILMPVSQSPATSPTDRMTVPPIPQSNILLLVIICGFLIFSILSLLVSRLICSSSGRRKQRKGSVNGSNQPKTNLSSSDLSTGNGFSKTYGASNTNSSTVAARMGTLARRRDNGKLQQDNYWINALEQQSQGEVNGFLKSNSGSSFPEKTSQPNNQDLNMAMVSIQRGSPQFATTHLAPAPDYRFTTAGSAQVQTSLDNQAAFQPTSHYHSGHFPGHTYFDQMDNATASALMTMSKRQQQQLQKYRIEFASTQIPPGGTLNVPLGGPGGTTAQAPSPNQQPPPPPPLNIEQPQQSLYDHHPGTLQTTRSLRLNRLYNPVNGSFKQANDSTVTSSSGMDPLNYTASTVGSNFHNSLMIGSNYPHSFATSGNSNTLQFHPHQSSTLLSRRSANTLRSFQTGAPMATYGQLGVGQQFLGSQISGNNQNGVQQKHLLQSHQAVINQLNQSSYPSLPLKHVSAVRPQIVSSLEDQIELELAEKDQQQMTGTQQDITQEQAKLQHQQEQQPQIIEQ